MRALAARVELVEEPVLALLHVALFGPRAGVLDAAVQLEGHQVLKVLEPGASGKFGNCNS